MVSLRLPTPTRPFPQQQLASRRRLASKRTRLRPSTARKQRLTGAPVLRRLRKRATNSGRGGCIDPSCSRSQTTTVPSCAPSLHSRSELQRRKTESTLPGVGRSSTPMSPRLLMGSAMMIPSCLAAMQTASSVMQSSRRCTRNFAGSSSNTRYRNTATPTRS